MPSELSLIKPWLDDVEINMYRKSLESCHLEGGVVCNCMAHDVRDLLRKLAKIRMVAEV